VREACERLQAARASVIGSVLNDRDNPPLLSELQREINRLSRFMPRRTPRWGRSLERFATLTVRV
jgi:hypothetical protein